MADQVTAMAPRVETRSRRQAVAGASLVGGMLTQAFLPTDTPQLEPVNRVQEDNLVLPSSTARSETTVSGTTRLSAVEVGDRMTQSSHATSTHQPEMVESAHRANQSGTVAGGAEFYRSPLPTSALHPTRVTGDSSQPEMVEIDPPQPEMVEGDGEARHRLPSHTTARLETTAHRANQSGTVAGRSEFYRSPLPTSALQPTTVVAGQASSGLPSNTHTRLEKSANSAPRLATVTRGDRMTRSSVSTNALQSGTTGGVRETSLDSVSCGFQFDRTERVLPGPPGLAESRQQMTEDQVEELLMQGAVRRYHQRRAKEAEEANSAPPRAEAGYASVTYGVSESESGPTRRVTPPRGSSPPAWELDHLMKLYLPGERRRPPPAPTFEGNTDIDYFLADFEETAELNQWSRGERHLHLKRALSSKIRPIVEGTTDYEGLCVALRMRYRLTSDDAADGLRRTKMQASEHPADLAQHLQRLVRVAFANLPEHQQEECAVREFVRLYDDQEFRLRPPANLTEAVRRAQAMYRAGTRPQVRALSDEPAKVRQHLEMSELRGEVRALAGTVEALSRAMRRQTTTPPPSTGPRRCYACQQAGHYARECPTRRAETPPGNGTGSQ